LSVIKKILTSVVFFLIVFTLISAAADLYYHHRLMHPKPEDKGWTCRCDFRVYWTAGYKLINYAFPALAAQYPEDPEYREKLEEYVGPNKARVYDTSEPFYHFRYSPVTAFFMVPFALITYPANALVVWFILLNIALTAALFLLTRWISSDFNLSAGARSIVLWSAFMAALRFYLMSMAVGQSDVIVALFFVIFLAAYVGENEAAGGIMFALILLFKPFFLPALLYFLLAGKKKLVFSALAGFVVLSFAPAVVIGFDKAWMLLKDWVGILNFSVPSQILNYKNQSITYFIGKHLMNFSAVKSSVSAEQLFFILGAAFTVLAYSVLLYFKKAHMAANDRSFRYLEVSLVIIITLLFSPLVWVAHFIYLIVPGAVAAVFVMKSRDRGRQYVALALFFGFSVIAGTDITKFVPVLSKMHFANIAVGAFFLAYALVSSYSRRKL